MKDKFLLALMLSALMVVTVQAQEEKAEEKKQEAAEEKQEEPKTFVELRSAMTKEQAEVLKDYRAAKPGSMEQQEALQKYYAVGDKYADKIIAMIKEDPSSRVGLSMLQQLAQMTRTAAVRKRAITAMYDLAKKDPKSDNSFSLLMMLVTGPVTPKMKAEAQAMLIENHGDSEKMGEFAMSMARAPGTKDRIELLKSLIEKSPHDSVKGPATYALGKMLFAAKDTKEEGMALIKSIPEKFADVTVYNGRANLAEMVAGEIFEMERLQIGMEVPDIEGEDVDGVEFKLSDYRGKVVVIDFWGDW